MNLLFNLLRIFNLNLSASNSALSALLGLSMGILPLLSPIVWVILALGLILRLNAAYFALFWLLGELLGTLFNQPISTLGEYFLTAQFLQELWQQWYNQTLWRFLNFNHTYVMGSSITLIVLALPLWIIFYFLIKQYQKLFLSTKLKGFVSLPLIRKLFQVTPEGERKKISFVKKWINVKGSLFLIIMMSIMVTITYFVQTSTVKNFMHQKLSEQWGAPIEIDSVSLSLSPIGFKVVGLELSGLKDNHKKAFSAHNLTFHINLYHLVAGRLVFEDVIISQVSIDLEQFSSNIEDNKRQPVDTFNIDFPAIPTAEEILGEGQFKTYQQSQQLNTAIKSASNNTQKIKGTIPSEQVYKNYQQRIQELQKKKIDTASIPQTLQEVAKLKSEISADLEKFNQAKTALKKDFDGVHTIMKELPKAPQDDWKRIRQQYEINIANTGNLMNLIFGEKISKWVKSGQLAFNYAKPYIESYQANQSPQEPEINYFKFGRYIAFKEYDPQPSFNIRRFFAQSNNQSWTLMMRNINIDHVTSQLASTGTLTLKEPNTTIAPKIINVTIDHRKHSNIINQLDFDSGQQLTKNETLLDSSNLSMIIQQANQHQSFTLNLKEKEKIYGFWQQSYTNIQWDNERMQKAKGNATRPGIFNKITDIKNQIKIGGKVTAPKIDFSSNLDSRLSNVLKGAMQQTLDANKQKAKDKLNEDASKILSEGRNSLVMLTKQKEELEKNQKKWQRELEQKLTQYQEELQKKTTSQVKEQVKQKANELKDKLLDTFKLN